MKVKTLLHKPSDDGKMSITLMFGGENDTFWDVWHWGWTLLWSALRIGVTGNGGFTLHTHVSQVEELPEYKEFMANFQDWQNKQ